MKPNTVLKTVFSIVFILIDSLIVPSRQFFTFMSWSLYQFSALDKESQLLTILG